MMITPDADALDIIDYGFDLADYIVREFREPKVTVDFWRNYV